MAEQQIKSGQITNLDYSGAVRVRSLPAPGAPTVAPIGTAGATTYSYYVVAIDRNGNKTTASAVSSTTTGNATLSVGNFNTISWTAVPFAVSYDVVRSVGGTNQGSIALATSSTSINDIGIVASAYVTPTRNSTADLQIDGGIGIGAVSPASTGLYIASGNVGIGAAPAANVGLTIAGSTTTVLGTAAYGQWLVPTLNASANGDTLTGLVVNPTFNDNARTGVIHLGIDIQAGGLKVTNIGVGAAPVSQFGIHMPLALSLTTVGNQAYGMNIAPTLVANGNGDAMVGVSISPTWGNTSINHASYTLSLAAPRAISGGVIVSSGFINFSGITNPAASFRVLNIANAGAGSMSLRAETTGGNPPNCSWQFFTTNGTSENTAAALKIDGNGLVSITSSVAGAGAGLLIQTNTNVPPAGPANSITLSSAITNTATAGANTLPATPYGFWVVDVGGVQKKIPIYNA